MACFVTGPCSDYFYRDYAVTTHPRASKYRAQVPAGTPNQDNQAAEMSAAVCTVMLEVPTNFCRY